MIESITCVVENVSGLSYVQLNRRTKIARCLSALGAFGLLLVGLAATVTPAPAVAASGTNQTINYQGRLLTATGAVVADGTYNMQFQIWQDGNGCVTGCTSANAAANNGGTLKWTENWIYGTGSPDNRVTVRNGYFSVSLGSLTAFGSNVDWNQDTLWLTTNIGNTSTASTFAGASADGVMIPFKRVTSAAYALNSAMLGGLTSAQYLQLAQGVQTDVSTSNPSIGVNKTGGTADIVNLQRSGATVLQVSTTGTALFRPTTDSATALQVQKAGTTTTVFTVDSTNTRIGVGTATPGYAVDAVGSVNASVSLKVAGTDVCTNTGCTVSSTSGVQLQGTTPGTQQTGNFNVSGTGIAGSLLAGLHDTASAGVLSIGTTNATSLSVGKTGVTTSINGITQIGATAGTGALVNNGSTSNTTLALTNFATGGSIGTAATTVDIYSSISINQTTAAQSLTVPNPTSATAGRILYILNTGSTPFNLLGSPLTNGAAATLVWNGSAWVFSGADANSILNQSASTQTANFNISGTAAAGQLTVTGSAANIIGGSSFQLQNASNTPYLIGATTFTNRFAIDPSFEAGTWGVSGSGTGLSVSRYTANTANVRSGQASLQIVTASGTANTGASTNAFAVPFTTGATYTLSFYAKASGSNFSTLRAGVAYNGSTETACTLNSNIVYTGGFLRYYCTFTAGTISGSPYVFVGASDTTTHTFYIDDVQLVAGSSTLAPGIGTVDLLGSVTSPLMVKPNSSSTEAFVVQNPSGTNLITADTINSQVLVGGTLAATTLSQNGNAVCDASGNCSGLGSYIQNQNSAQQTASNFWISGTGRADTALQAPSFDTATSTSLSIGASSATGVSIGKSGAVVSLPGELNITGTDTTTNNVRFLMNGTLNSASTGSQYGFQNQTAFNPSGASLSAAYGFVNTPSISGSSIAVTDFFGGVLGITTGSGFTGTVSTGTGLQINSPTINGTNKFSTYIGLAIPSNSANGGNTSGTINNSQIRVYGNTAGAGTGGTVNNYGVNITQPSGTGGTTNNYGLYIQGAGAGSSNWSLYNNSTAASYFAGNLSSGGTIAAVSLTQNGNTVCDSSGNCSIGGGSGSYIQNQNAAQQTTSNFWISGTGRADTSLQSPLVDTATGVALGIGTSNATSVGIGKSGVTTTVNGSAIVSEALNIQGTFATTSTNKLGVTGALNSSATGSQYGITNQTSFSPTGASLTNIYGLNNSPTLSGSALNITTFAASVTGLTTTSGYTGQVNTGYGLLVSSPSVGGSQTISQYKGILINSNSSNGGNTSGSVVNVQLDVNGITAGAGTGGTAANYGVRIQIPSGTGGTTANYGLQINGNGGGTSSWSLQNNSTAPSYYAGDVRVGTLTNPNAYLLNVNGTVGATSLLASTVDTQSAVALNIGTTNASIININQNVYVAADKSIGMYASAAATNVINAQVTGDANPRFAISADGTLRWGGGTGAFDTALGRVTGGALTTSQNLSVGTTSVFNAKLSVQAGSATAQALVARGAASQSVNILEVRSSSDRVQAAFTSGGNQLALGRISGDATSSAGSVKLGDGSTTTAFGSTLQTNTLTADRTISLPDSTGTVCLDSGNCSAAGGYILNSGTLQTATFYISGSGISNSSLLAPLMGTADQVAAATSSTALSVVTGAASGSGASNSGALTVKSGNSTNGNSGNVTIDVGTAGGTRGSINIGTTSASNITLGSSATTAITLATSVLTKTTSATAFTVQSAGSSNNLLTVDTQNTQVVIGNSGNTVTFASTGEPTLAGTARHAKSLVVQAEYAGAVLDATNDTAGTVNCSTTNNGSMSSGFDLASRMNYYNWTSSQAGGQCYDVVAQIPIPSDWAAWQSTTPFSVQLYSSSTANGQYAMEVRNSSGTAESSTASWATIGSLGAASTWTAVSPTTLASTTTGYTAGDYLTIRIRMQSKNNANMRAGNITLNYYSKY